MTISARFLSRVLALLAFFSVTSAVDALEYVSIEREGRQLAVTGRSVASADDTSVLIMARDGVLWTLKRDEIKKQEHDDKPFEVYDRTEMIAQLQRELPSGYRFHNTAHFLIAYNTTKPYAQWCGSLYERLYVGFYNYWKRRGIKLSKPAWPMVAIIFNDKTSYVSYAEQEMGDAAEGIVGYYSIRTNRIATFDLTGVDGVRTGGKRASSQDVINQILAQPAAAPLVATLIHEATHQLSFNSGLQRRYIDNPVWLSEGIAVFFETPDLGNSKGWRTVGALNGNRLRQFREYLPQRTSASLTSLVTSDKRMRDPKDAPEAYAESWALTYFLLKKNPQAFARYLADIRGKEPLQYDTPDERMQRFRKHFGADSKALDQDFLRFIEKVR